VGRKKFFDEYIKFDRGRFMTADKKLPIDTMAEIMVWLRVTIS
jgi:hypothetical protein